MKLNRIAIIGSLLGCAALFAQDPSVNQRKENQQDRIANGIQSGQLTAGETKNLENKESNLNKEISSDRKANGGTLTSAEKQQVNKQQNNLSNQIHQDKTNANTAKYGNNEVGARRQLQQDRIAQGVRNGTLKPGQTANIEKQEQKTNQADKADRAANGGKLTPTQKQQLNKSLDKTSQKIAADKHK